MNEQLKEILERELSKAIKPLMQQINDLQNAYNKPKQLEEQAKQNEVNKGLAEMRPAVGNGDTRGAGYSQSFYDDLV